ncbi:hypothetical protein [Falsiruegeria mediterranea]|uniref:hypothetical protein n=1 Tax=Falsiruegeria mediterranea TaxID=1280832 RepID=UPI0015F28D5E|nr:hypothetical protein [Falsiruegeria mediterranea]
MSDHLQNPFRATAPAQKRPAISAELKQALAAGQDVGDPSHPCHAEGVAYMKRTSVTHWELRDINIGMVEAVADQIVPIMDRLTRLEKALTHALTEVEDQITARANAFTAAEPTLSELERMAEVQAKDLQTDDPMMVRQVMQDGEVVASSREPQEPVFTSRRT